MIDQKDFAVQQLGECTYQSPMKGEAPCFNENYAIEMVPAVLVEFCLPYLPHITLW